MRIRLQRRAFLTASAIAAVAVGLVAAGCGGKTASDKPGKQPAGLTALQPEEVTILAAADRVDGQTDKVVANCANCRLNMAGKPEHALQAGEYAMHFCSESCKTQFAEDMHASIQALRPSGE